ncbi:hypothetical protein [Pedosphaera parvula]|uniref:Uncharacterized protein n=1 Tax=Pedosphaera parvula (strain Ellin514) TaxID=320771 RepID=B9XQA7_PEDPL|nr:hypothetical protein [Pedosphaera parvula]EEF57931.1 hypothetical protein Cflav_PD1106 [Pedosphaera parvula Ellin514]
MPRKPHSDLNLADTMTVFTILGCPAAAGLAAASEKAGWSTMLFVVLGTAIGFAAGYVVQRLSYLLLATSASQSRTSLGWLFLFAYIILPMIVAFGALLTTAGITVWLARQIL